MYESPKKPKVFVVVILEQIKYISYHQSIDLVLENL